jgi:signal transduction histidine kinase
MPNDGRVGGVAREEARRLKGRLLAPLVCVLLLLLAAAGGLAAVTAQRLNEQALTEETQTIRNAVDALRIEISRTVFDYAYWNEMVENMVEARDADWGDENVAWLGEEFGFHSAYVLDADNSQIYGMVDQRRDARSALGLLGEPLKTLIAETRASSMERPLPASGFIGQGGQVLFVVACAISRERPSGELLAPRDRPVLIGTQTVESLVKRFAQELLLDELGVTVERDRSAEAAVPLPSPGGQAAAAWLVWQPQRPSAQMVSAVAPVALAVLLVCTVLVGLAFRNISLVADQVTETVDRLADANAELAQSEEAERQARLRAEEASRAKSVFLANASRELRTPLNAVIGVSELVLMQEAEERDAGELAIRLGSIRDNAVALLRTINDLIDLSRAEVGRQRVEPEPILAAPALDRIRRRLSSVSEPREVQIDFVHHDPGLEVWADAMAFDRVTTTLLTNALTSSHAGGRVTVEARKTADGGVAIVVRDFGTGIPPERLSSIFQPFGESFHHGEAGSGLGLAIVKALMDLHGGTVGVDSEPRAGTTVTVTFPPAPLRERHAAQPVAA